MHSFSLTGIAPALPHQTPTSYGHATNTTKGWDMARRMQEVADAPAREHATRDDDATGALGLMDTLRMLGGPRVNETAAVRIAAIVARLTRAGEPASNH